MIHNVSSIYKLQIVYIKQNTIQYHNILLSPQVRMKLVLERRFSSYLLTSILPSLVLMLAGVGTLLLPTDRLADRLDATLACLIVIASLFSQVRVSASPNLF